MSEPSTCLECGRPLIGGRCPDCDAQGLFQFVHREIVVLVALGAITLAVFVMTRAAALSSERIRMRDAAEWYAIGTAHLQSGETASAIQAFRRATSAARDNRTYRTGLADPLAAAHEHDAARQAPRGKRRVTGGDSPAPRPFPALGARRSGRWCRRAAFCGRRSPDT